MVTPTYTVVLLQYAIMLDTRTKPASPLCAQTNVALATAIKSPTQVADKNLVVSRRSTRRQDRTRAKMVTPTYTVVLLQIAIMLKPRAKPESPPVFNHKTRANASAQSIRTRTDLSPQRLEEESDHKRLSLHHKGTFTTRSQYPVLQVAIVDEGQDKWSGGEAGLVEKRCSSRQRKIHMELSGQDTSR